MWTTDPTRTRSGESSDGLITDAERSLSSSDAMRASSMACSFLASSYSEFSEMSPNSRASLMRSATSRRFCVERCSISALRLSRPSGVRRTSFCIGAASFTDAVSGGSADERRSMVAQVLQDLALLREGVRGVQLGKRGARLAEPREVPRMELPQVASGALLAEMLDRAVDDPVELVEDLLARGLALPLVEQLGEQPRVAERTAGENDRSGAGVIKHPADVVGRVEPAGDDHRDGQRLDELLGEVVVGRPLVADGGGAGMEAD